MDDFAQVDDTANCFVPEMLVEFIDKKLQQGQEGIEPASFFINGVCLLVDISGFTKLSGDFCEMGKSGIDELQLATNGYMGKLVEIVYTFGGEIIKFAGDAIICVFSASFVTALEEPKKKGGRARRSVYDIKGLHLAGIDTMGGIDENAEDNSPIKSPGHLKKPPSFSHSHKPLPNVPAETVLRAMHCAAVLREVQTEKLSVHVAMSCGEMCFGILGGVENRWECLISGPCIHQLSDCLDDAPSKTAVISPECAAILRNSTMRNSVAQMDLELSEHPDTVHKSFMVTRAGRYEFELTILPSGNQRIVTVTCIEANKLETAGSKSLTARSSPQLSQMIRQFVPVPIADGLDNAAGLSYLAEIREVTTMFMKWDSYDATGKHRNLIDLQNCFYEAQRILHSTGAYLRQFLVDDKGCVLIGCWGMPHLSYLDNAHRALSAAAQIRYEFNKLDMQCSFGITTGDVYCGTVGSALRMEYAAIGSVVNMSARLMCKADGGILIDDATYDRLPSNVLESLKALDPIKVKGRDQPLQVYKYTSNTSIHVREKVVEDHEISAVCKNTLLSVVDRMASKELKFDTTAEIKRSGSLKDWIAGTSGKSAVITASKLPIVLLSGKDGSGRTTVVVWLKKQAQDRQLQVLNVKVGKKDGQVPFMVWKKLFQQLMPKDLFLSTETQRSYVRALLKEVFPGAPQVAEKVGFPVLRSVLGITCSYADGVSVEDTKGWGNSILAAKVKPNTKAAQAAVLSTIDTLSKIFALLLNVQTSLVIIENIENADESSLMLLMELTRLSTRSVMVLTALVIDAKGGMKNKNSLFQTSSKSFRLDPFQSTPWCKSYRDTIQKLRSTTNVMLENYTREEIDKMLSAALGVRTVPPEISQLVQDFSGGSYFWVREILQFIKEHGPELFMSAIGESNTPVAEATTASTAANTPSAGVKPKPVPPAVSPGHGTPPQKHTSVRQLNTAKSFAAKSSRSMSISGHSSVHSMHGPSSTSQLKLDKLVLCRFENLHADVQHVLRTASIIGNIVNSTVLYGVLPRHLKDQMSDCLKSLLNQKWLYQDTDNESLYQFAHPHAHAIIYELTPSSERSHIHKQIADYVEETYFDDKTQFAALSSHYKHCDSDKALHYCVQAVAVILANVVVIFDFEDCLELLQSSFPSCKTSFDVDCLMKMVSDARIALEKFDLNNRPIAPKGFFASLLSGCVGDSGAVAPDESSLLRSSTGSDKSENSGADSENGSDKNYERQAQAYFLTELDKLNDQLCEKYVDVVDSDNAEEAKEWQRHLLGLSSTKSANVVTRFIRTVSVMDSRKGNHKGHFE